jgi:nicotinamidase-related amidase
MNPLPSFYEPHRVGELYLERAGEVTAAARRYAQENAIAPASQDKFRVVAFGIDAQNAFCAPGASLFVPGAVEDMRRSVEWLYRNVDGITSLVFSLDTHRVFQIFHPSWWVDAEGNHPPPLTPIAEKDVREGRWRPVAQVDESVEYLRKLEASGKYVHTIWPYHALLGGLSHALLPSVMEASLFHAVARRQPTHFETKGLHELTENYSVLSPEVTELAGQSVGGFNERLFDQLMSFDRVYVFGEAKSHCVLSTLEDLLQRIQRTDPTLARKIWILEDAMSPVPAPPIQPLPPSLDFPRIADEAMRRFERAGMTVTRTTERIEVPR